MTRRAPEMPAKPQHAARPGVTVREIIGSPRHNGGALLVERNGRWACDRCGKWRRIMATVLVPIVRGHSRPRFDAESQPTVSICWRCIVSCMVALFVRRAPKVAA